MTHSQLVQKAVAWLRSYRCGVVLSEQACLSGEMPDAIGWKRACHSVLVECKVSRADFLADRDKPFRSKQEMGLGCERFYLTPAALIHPDELPPGWGLLECHKRKIRVLHPAAKNLRTATGFRYEMNLAARQPSPRGNPHRTPEPDRIFEVEESHGGVQPGRPARRRRSRRGRTKLLSGDRSCLQLNAMLHSLIGANPCPFSYKKKTGLVGPASYSVELRCGYITARRKLAENALAV